MSAFTVGEKFGDDELVMGEQDKLVMVDLLVARVDDYFPFFERL